MFEAERLAIDGVQIEHEINSLLPVNGTQLEYDLIASILERQEAISFPLRDLVDPATAPEELLPWLAWQYSIDLWDEAWDVSVKRSIILRWAALHRIKGTKAGIVAHVAYTGATVTQIIAPPVNAYCGRSYTQAERDAWLAPMPQLRIYSFQSTGDGTGKSFPRPNILALGNKLFGGRSGPDKDGWSYRACMPLTDASSRIGSRSFYYDPETGGPIVPLNTVTIQKQSVTEPAIQQVSKNGAAGLGVFLGRTKLSAAGYLGGSASSGVTYTLALDGGYTYTASSLQLNAVSPSLTPVDTRFEYVQDTGTRVYGQVFSRAKQEAHSGNETGLGRAHAGKKFLPPSTARNRIYQRLYLFDPTRAVSTRRARQFLGNMRLGMPDFTAEISVDITNKRLRQSANDFVRGFLHKTPQTKLLASLRAIRISKAARDETLVKIGLKKIPYLGEGLPLDTDYRFGDRV